MSVISVSIAKQIADDYTKYALSTLNRSLPTAVDGLKSVQRRIVQVSLSMQAGQWQKVSRIAGETMARLHPHGDCSGAICVMANSADLNHPLIDGHGNFGGWSAESRQRISSDGPAASRYIEARASAFARAIFDIPEHLLEQADSYDGRAKEVLCYVPAVPLALLNGAIGIATGYATHNANYNLLELTSILTSHLRDKTKLNDAISNAKLLPDWPSKARILASHDAIRSVQKGQGSLQLRGSWEFDTAKRIIYITALPLHDAEAYINKVVEAKQKDQLNSLTGIRDLSNRHGIRIAIEYKKGASPTALLGQLLRHTPLEKSFSINSTMLGKDNIPVRLSVASALYAWLTARRNILHKKYSYELKLVEARLEIVEGLILLAEPDFAKSIVLLIIASEDRASAIASLIGQNFTERQADAILSLPIGKLNKQNRTLLTEEKQTLQCQRTGLQKLVSSEDALDECIANQLDAIANKYGYERFCKVEANWLVDKASAPIKLKPVSKLAKFKVLCSKLDPPIPQKLMRRAINYKSVKTKVHDTEEEACKALVALHIQYWANRGKANTNPYDELSDLCCQAELDKLNSKFKQARVKRMTLNQLKQGLNKYFTIAEVERRHIAYWKAV